MGTRTKNADGSCAVATTHSCTQPKGTDERKVIILVNGEGMDMASERLEKARKLATEIAAASNTDLLIYNGMIGRPYDREIIKLCNTTKLRKNVVLFLCTMGGDAGPAYRIARCLQDKYDKFSICICGPCKSAGTLIAIGAQEIIVNDYGELGPLDVQLGRKDELWETDSGLTVLSAIKHLEETSYDLFETCFLRLKGRSGGRITLKTATSLASNFATTILEPVIAQIDPMHVGEVSRAMNIGLEYGHRLSAIGKNTKDETIIKLTNAYPSHDFVIDSKEITELFEHVRLPSEQEFKLIDLLGYAVQQPEDESATIVFISKSLSELESEHEDNHQDNAESRIAASASAAQGIESNVLDRQSALRGTGENVARLTPKVKDSI